MPDHSEEIVPEAKKNPKILGLLRVLKVKISYKAVNQAIWVYCTKEAFKKKKKRSA